jgi:hypothetical protein
VVVASENPDHQAIEELAQQQHEERSAIFRRDILRGSYPAPVEREATNRDLLEWARDYHREGAHDQVISMASRILGSGDASRNQIAEALRLRAVALAGKGRFLAAFEDAHKALDLHADAGGIVPASYLRALVESWRFKPDNTPLIGP